MKILPLVAFGLASISLFSPSVGARPNQPPDKQIEADSAPTIKEWTPAKFPAAAPKNVATGSAMVRVTVDASGAITAVRVLNATEPAFGEAAVAAAKQWVYSPAEESGQKIAMCLDVPFEFDRDNPTEKTLLPEERLLPKVSPHTDATAEDTPLDEYPESLHGRGIPGVIDFRCHVNADGTYSNFQVLSASHADFVLPVLRSVPTWKFSPGKQGDLTVGTDLIGEVSFRDSGAPPRDQVLAANGIKAADGSAPDPAPAPLRLPDPVFPFDELLAGESGSATVEFTVASNGVVRDVHLREATKPVYGAALVAAVEASTFDAAVSHGVGVDANLVRHYDFTAIPKDAKDEGTGLAHLVALARAKAIGSAKGLDAKITPLYRMVPVNPQSLAEGEKGQAVIEFVIDQQGRGRIPRIISATKPEFGWAAATAISQWVFNAPTKNHQPTEIRVQVPFAF